MSTHPPSEERVKQMNEMAAAAPAVRNPLVSSADYSRAKQIAAALKPAKK